MKIGNKDVDINEAIDFANYDSLLLKKKENRMLLSDYQINVLNRCGLNYKNYNNIRDLLFDIEEVLFDNYDEELDLVSYQISEFIYYSDTKK